MVEHEESFVFTYESFDDFQKKQNLQMGSEIDITDHYLSSDVRIRMSSVSGEATLTRKSGDKKDGYRLEDECLISKEAANLLISDNKLVVKKRRHTINGLDSSFDKYKVTVDFIETPMKLVILEVEAADEVGYPIPLDVTDRIFNVPLKRCPLGAWDLFKRKIAFCGAPSSGKTEFAKWVSYILNTRFKANSFHVIEYATSFIQKYNRLPKFADQIFILQGQWRRERNAQMHDIILSDCPTFLAYIYAQLMDRKEFSDEVALQLSKLYKQSLFDVKSYSDIIFLRLQEYQDNNVRYQTPDEALNIQRRIEEFLQDHRIPHRVGTYNDAEMILAELFYINGAS